jgi:hypothetical protein
MFAQLVTFPAPYGVRKCHYHDFINLPLNLLMHRTVYTVTVTD